MALQHVYLKDQVISHITEPEFALDLSNADLNHLKVLRIMPGEHLSVIDASLDYFECEVVYCDPKTCVVRIAQKLDRIERPYICLAQGLAKGEKMEQIFRHATEVGVSQFVPLACDRSIVKLDPRKQEAKLKRWEGIIESAAQQSGQPALPVITPVCKLRDLPLQAQDYDAVLVFWEEASLENTIGAALARLKGNTHARVLIVVGPEGGLSQEEIEALGTIGERLHIVSLGSSILRTETAGIVAPSLVLYELVGRL